jgi:hypothetical protein
MVAHFSAAMNWASLARLAAAICNRLREASPAKLAPLLRLPTPAMTLARAHALFNGALASPAAIALSSVEAVA